MGKSEYNLDFYEAYKIVMEGGAVKGDNFVDGIYLELTEIGKLAIVDAGRCYAKDTDHVYLKGMVRQKFRSLTVMTMRELCK